jgi:hypothetical protein
MDHPRKAFKEALEANRLAMNTQRYTNEMLKHYLIAALWSSNDDEGNPLDDNYTLRDISREAERESRRDVVAFLRKARKILEEADISPESAGHDFWLTRNGHGAGFWDRDYPRDIGKELTDISDSFREVDMYVGDDGEIYV